MYESCLDVILSDNMGSWWRKNKWCPKTLYLFRVYIETFYNRIDGLTSQEQS